MRAPQVDLRVATTERSSPGGGDINVDIVKSLFMPLFLGTTLTSCVLGGIGLLRWGEPGSLALLAGAVVHVTGMFVVTMVFNVPLNNALAAVDPASGAGAAEWARYVKVWTTWNHVRTMACTIATVLFMVALSAR